MRCRSSRGFTLIELLVVIAIIAILAAILFPVFAKAREKARQTACLNNERQIATAIMIRTQDDDETFPEASSVWDEIKIDKGVLHCPSSSKKITNSYVYNHAMSGMAMADVLEPTNEVLLADGQTKTDVPSIPIYTNVAYMPCDLQYRHDRSIIATYADGHVALTKALNFNLTLVKERIGGATLEVDSAKPANGDAGKPACTLPEGFPIRQVGSHGYKLINILILGGNYQTQNVVKEPFASAGTTLLPDLGASALPTNCGCNQKPIRIALDGTTYYGGWGWVGNAGASATWDIKLPPTDFTRHTLTFTFAGPCGGSTNNLNTISLTTNSGAEQESIVNIWPNGGQAAAIWQATFVGSVKLKYAALTNAGHPNCIQGPAAFFLD